MLPYKISHDVTQGLRPVKVYRRPLYGIRLLCTPELDISYLFIYAYMNLKLGEKGPLSASH